MKKVILQMDSSHIREAGETLASLTGVMVSSVNGDTLTVHCGQRLDSSTLINKLKDNGFTASIVDQMPGAF